MRAFDTMFWVIVSGVGIVVILLSIVIDQGTEAERKTHVKTLTCPVDKAEECVNMFNLHSAGYAVQRLVSMDQKEVIFEITECEKR